MEETTEMTVQSPSWSQLRDDMLTRELLDTLACDQRTAHLELSISTEGRVVQVKGQVGSEEERQRLRRLLRRQDGLYAVWDFLSLPNQQLAVADIGCGSHKQADWACGVDRFALPGVDVVTNLEAALPFEENSFDHIFAIHVLEHIVDLMGLMGELHRVLRPTGVLHIFAPYWRHVHAVADPTHVRFIDMQTFRYFCQPHPGVLPWQPLIAASSDDTVFADLQPLKDGTTADPSQVARWFY
ncbi:MAG TPA: class I SAM-dependent methyltransferase [Ktedonobacteraceae bacterium]|nr:class I SAM-dependent methyltransferase [Ktedonobacteraceae bacterium]